jgi:2-methylisocitrate lyase-like PEP mutase family enzyme
VTTQVEQAKLFKSLHVSGDPLVLFNVWDAGSARAVEEVGAKAIATGSWSVAAAHGYEDGEKLPLDLALANLRRIKASVELPVTLDFEGAYALHASDLRTNVARVIEAGAIGINFEDQIVGGTELYSIGEQTARIRAVREAAEAAAVPLFINARTDIYLKADPSTHSESHLEEAVRRATAYAEAGASGFFAPGLRDARSIEKLCKLTTLPVNILFYPDAPVPKKLAELGVARISYGPRPFRLMIVSLQEAARNALSLV